MSLETLLEKAKVYDSSEDKAISQESGRLEFISKFPLERIGSLSIDEYVAGTDKNSFSYWLEFKKYYLELEVAMLLSLGFIKVAMEIITVAQDKIKSY
ncbi:MAG: hypothetical protein IPO16_02660 [Saprospiraceae bacterium]|nr:hypothetical protein [Saprospiraceae bacterium]